MTRYKKVAFFVLLVFFANVGVVSASHLNILSNMLDSLYSQLEEVGRSLLGRVDTSSSLTAQIYSPTAPTSIACPSPSLTYNLQYNSRDIQTGGQVSSLQKFLWQYKSVYPNWDWGSISYDNFVTGFYGTKTRRIVKDFQDQFAIVPSSSSEYGKVWQTTRSAIANLCTARVTVVSPNGGEEWKIGETRTIIWRGTNFPLDGVIGIAITDTNQTYTYLFSELSNSGSLSWTIPSSIASGLYRVRIWCGILGTDRYCTADGARNSYAEDYSDSAFQISGDSATTLARGGYIVVVDSSAPTERWIAGGSNGVLLNVLRFTATTEDMALTDLRLQLDTTGSSTGADFAAIELWDGSTLVQRKVAPAFSGDVEDFVFPVSGVGSFVLPKDSAKLMTIRADLAPICLGCPGTAGQLIGTDYDGAGVVKDKQHAVGLVSGTVYKSITRTDQQGQGVVSFHAVPNVRKQMLSEIAVSGEQGIYRFGVKAIGGDIKLNRVTFAVATSGITAMHTQLPAFRLYSLTLAEYVSSATGSVASYFADKKNYDEQNRLLVRMVAGEYRIPAGEEHIFELRGTITDDSTAGGYLSATLLGDSGRPSVVKLTGVDARRMAPVEELILSRDAGRNNFIWSDLSSEAASANTTNSIYTSDWINGYRVPGLPSTGLDPEIKSFDGTMTPEPPDLAIVFAASTSTPPFIKISFSDNATNEDGFLLQRGTVGGATTTIATFSAQPGAVWYNRLKYFDYAVVPGVAYYYQAIAYNAAGSSYSQTKKGSLSVIPAAPSNLTFVSYEWYPRSVFNLRWQDNSTDESGFRLERSLNQSFTPFIVVATTGENVTTYRDYDIATSTLYHYRVKAFNSAGDSSYSNTATAYFSVSASPPLAGGDITPSTVQALAPAVSVAAAASAQLDLSDRETRRGLASFLEGFKVLMWQVEYLMNSSSEQ